jgi:L-asparaginase / beta-aspartyl-peptidase
MKTLYSLFVFVCFFGCRPSPAPQTNEPTIGQVAIALHGGAGNLKKLKLSADEETAYLYILDSALQVGHSMLNNGVSAVDAVEAVVVILEDSPLFNAGKGAVFNHEGKNELDAAIMDGTNQRCGAVACATTIKNPIKAARAVMQDGSFVLLSGDGANQFAAMKGLEMVDPGYFFTVKRWKQWQEMINEDSTALDHDKKTALNAFQDHKYGTVGCVALDKMGNLAAATSTGGITNKKYNRIGDSPIIGAGTYANNQSCAVSCTGKGEDFIRFVVGHTIASYIQLLKYTPKAAADSTMALLKSNKGRGGCIVVDRYGNIAHSFTTSGMFRASIDSRGQKILAIYSDKLTKETKAED